MNDKESVNSSESSVNEKEFTISIGEEEYILTFINSDDSIIFNVKNDIDFTYQYENVFNIEQIKEISNWFKSFSSLEEIFEELIKLMEEEKINFNLEENLVKMNFNIEKENEFSISLERKELTKDEMIENLTKENKELKIRVNNLEEDLTSFEERLQLIEKELKKDKGEKTEKSEKAEKGEKRGKKGKKEKKDNKEKNDKKEKKEKIKSEKNEIFKSDIINDEDKNTLDDWFNPDNNKTIKLLYKASKNGDSYKDFYKFCGNKGPTVTIILTTKGLRFGGFTKLSWKKPKNGPDNSKYYEDKDAFIFSLDKKKKYLLKVDKINYAVCMWSDQGPSFGDGNDLQISNNCLHNNNSYNNCPSSFQTEKNELNGGKNNFTVKDYEVYSIQ